MLDFIDVDYMRATSPTSTTALAEGSELFRTVMGDIMRDSYKTENGNRDTNDSKTNAKTTTSSLCRQCDKPSCRCNNSRRVDLPTCHRVQWADESYDGQLTREHRVDFDSPMSCSPSADVTDNIKSILKYRQERANCIIIVAD